MAISYIAPLMLITIAINPETKLFIGSDMIIIHLIKVEQTKGVDSFSGLKMVDLWFT